ncbi:amino acid permease [Streptomyces chartreusis]|uniref:amino acid permease n=1 Tax=Streptomyces chartreusis TaxID=1969 RepID=UPI00382E51D5
MVELVVLLDILAVFIGVSVSATRGLLAGARDGWLPRRLATVNLRRGAPGGALALLGVVYVAVIGVSNLMPGVVEMPGSPSCLSTYAWCSTFGIFCLAAVYLLMALGAPRGLRAHEPTWLLWPCLLVAAVTTGGALFGAVYQVPDPTVSVTYSAMGWFALALVAAQAVAHAVPAAGHRG